MKKKSRCPITKAELARRGLHLFHDTVRRLTVDDLAQVAAGCDTTSFTTERRTHMC
jgi:hypothetical protein